VLRRLIVARGSAVDVLGWLEVWLRDLQKADERREKRLQKLIFGKRVPTLGCKRHSFAEAAHPGPHDGMVWFAADGQV